MITLEGFKPSYLYSIIRKPFSVKNNKSSSKVTLVYKKENKRWKNLKPIPNKHDQKSQIMISIKQHHREKYILWKYLQIWKRRLMNKELTNSSKKTSPLSWLCQSCWNLEHAKA